MAIVHRAVKTANELLKIAFGNTMVSFEFYNVRDNVVE